MGSIIDLRLNKTNNVNAEAELHDGDSNSSPPTTAILLGLVSIYIFGFIVWFIHSRYFSSSNANNRRVSSFISLLRQRLTFWLSSIFRNNHTSHDTYNSLPIYHHLDESNYKSWSVFDVASWSRSKLIHHFHNHTNQCETDNQNDAALQEAIEVLIHQRIDGASLDYITLGYLSQWMPFGTAAHLMSEYDALVSTNSNPKSNNTTNNTLSRDLPSWYNESLNHQSRSSQHDDVEAQALLHSEEIERLMKDRLGFSLPALRTAETPDHASAASLEMTDRVASIKDSQPAKGNNDNSNNLDSIMNGMPPHIRAIAERRPDLVAELMASRQNNQTVHKDHLLPIHEEVEEDTDYDSESVSLLRRRIK